jgi:hypothetical protein
MNDVQPNPEDAEPIWALYRIDDNGNVFLVRSGLTRSEANRLAAEFEARGHKQMYWVERGAGPADPGPPTPTA